MSFKNKLLVNIYLIFLPFVTSAYPVSFHEIKIHTASKDRKIILVGDLHDGIDELDYSETILDFFANDTSKKFAYINEIRPTYVWNINIDGFFPLVLDYYLMGKGSPQLANVMSLRQKRGDLTLNNWDGIFPRSNINRAFSTLVYPLGDKKSGTSLIYVQGDSRPNGSGDFIAFPRVVLSALNQMNTILTTTNSFVYAWNVTYLNNQKKYLENYVSSIKALKGEDLKFHYENNASMQSFKDNLKNLMRNADDIIANRTKPEIHHYIEEKKIVLSSQKDSILKTIEQITDDAKTPLIFVLQSKFLTLIKAFLDASNSWFNKQQKMKKAAEDFSAFFTLVLSFSNEILYKLNSWCDLGFIFDLHAVLPNSDVVFISAGSMHTEAIADFLEATYKENIEVFAVHSAASFKEQNKTWAQEIKDPSKRKIPPDTFKKLLFGDRNLEEKIYKIYK